MPQIRVKNGQQKNRILQVEGSAPVIVGRDSTANLQVIDKGVSREHAEIYRVGEMVFIRDLGSRNGTFVNEEQIEEELLREGDVIRIGSTQLVFESTKAAQERKSEDLRYEDDEGFKTSLELKVDDLFVQESVATGRETEYFRAICQATAIVYGERDEKRLFEKLMDLIQEYIPADHIYLFLREVGTGAIVPRATRQKGSGGTIPISRTILKRVITESRAILTADAMQDDRFKTGDSIVMNQIRSVLCVPVHSGNTALGAIYAVNARMAETFDQTDLELLTAIGSQLAASMANLEQIRGRRKLMLCLIERLLVVLERDMPGHAGHAERVGRFAAAIGREMGMSDSEVLFLRLAGLFHDTGKHPTISGRRSSESKGAAHVLQTVEFLQDVPGIDTVLSYIRGHHEHVDGNGVPSGLKGDVIPLGARILAVASAFENLLYHGRDEKAPLPDSGEVRKVLTELGNKAGEAFDGAVIKALMVAYRHNTLFGDERTDTASPAEAERKLAPPPKKGGDTDENEALQPESSETIRAARSSSSQGSSKKSAPIGEGAASAEE